jgi:hypothetical protein
MNLNNNYITWKKVISIISNSYKQCQCRNTDHWWMIPSMLELDYVIDVHANTVTANAKTHLQEHALEYYM